MVCKPFSEDNAELISYSSILLALKVDIDYSLKVQFKLSDYIEYGIYLRMPFFSSFFFLLIILLITLGNVQFEVEDISGTNLTS